MKYYVVDAFAEEVFEGNPAGVCVMDDWLADDLMQKIAIENNLSETAFAVKEGEGYRLRWFTPGGEIDLCGHATLATAFVIMNFIEAERTLVTFETNSGPLKVERDGPLYELDFPVATSEEIEVPDELVEALGIEPVEVFLNRDLLVVLESEEAVRALKPDVQKLLEIEAGLGVVVTAKSTEYDFVSRAFFPKLKVDEDPVTGSAHCALVPFLAERLKKEALIARQVSARGGTLHCNLDGERVKMAGKAALYLTGDLHLPK